MTKLAILRRGRIEAWLPAILWMALIFVLSSIPGTSLPAIALPQADKLVHTLVYAVLGCLVLRGIDAPTGTTSPGASRPLPRLAHALLAAALATVYGVSDEIHQLWTPHRSADWRDVIADALGGTLGSLGLVVGRWMKARACFKMRASKD